MGNRAVLEFQGTDVGIYLHWNGGRDTIEPLLEVAKEYNIRGGDYGIARISQILGNFFGGTFCVGVDKLDRLDCDNGDNGTYVIDNNLNIVGRKYFDNREEQQKYKPNEMKQHFKQVNDTFFASAL